MYHFPNYYYFGKYITVFRSRKVTRGSRKFCNQFTRSQANSVTDCSIVYRSKTCTVPRDNVNERRTRAIFFRSKICLDPCKWVSFLFKQTPRVVKIVPFFYAVEPPVSDHQKWRLNGRLREAVVYKNRTTGGLSREEFQEHLLYGR